MTGQVGTVYQSWVNPPPPMPILPPLDATNTGLGAALTIQGPKWLLTSNIILSAWVPPNPLPTLPQMLRRYTPGAFPTPPQPPVPRGGSAYVPRGVSAGGAVPVYTVVPTASGGISPRAGVANTVTTGGIAIVAVVGPVNGGYVTNPLNATAQGIMTAENINIDMVSPPAAGDAAAYGTTVLLVPGQNFSIPDPLAPGQQIWVNAATSGHQVTVVVW